MAPATTNRLSAATYDSVGNMTSWGSFAYQWRPTGEMRTRTGGGVNKWFAYDAGGQRVAVEDRNDGTLTLSIAALEAGIWGASMFAAAVQPGHMYEALE